jgi:D-alanyl-D-alanine carboxypeptidase
VRAALVLLLLIAVGCGKGDASTLRTSLKPVVANGVPAALVLVRDEDRTRSAAVGRTDSSARFRVGSVTKTFVAALVLQLVSERRLALDEPLSRWLPGLLPDGARITVRDLLAHRSGLADVADDPSVLDGPRSDWSARQLVALSARRPRTAATGGAFRYSSTNYLVLGLLVERVSGARLGSLLARRIFGPLHLADTAYVEGPIRGPHLHGYSLPSHQGVVDTSAAPRDLDSVSTRWAGASGDIVSSASDIARFFRALLSGGLLPRRELREMEAIRGRYGLGLAVYSTPCGRAWGHTGNLGGVLTVAWNTRDGRRQVVLAANEYPLSAAADGALRRAANTAFCSR